MSISGKSFVFTGKMANTREIMMETTKRYHGIAQSAVSSSTDYLVKGRNPGRTKLNAAKRLNVTIITENEFNAMVANVRIPSTNEPTGKPTVGGGSKIMTPIMEDKTFQWIMERTKETCPCFQFYLEKVKCDQNSNGTSYKLGLVTTDGKDEPVIVDVTKIFMEFTSTSNLPGIKVQDFLAFFPNDECVGPTNGVTDDALLENIRTVIYETYRLISKVDKDDILTCFF